MWLRLSGRNPAAPLAPEILERHPELESVAAAEIPGGVVIAPPGDPDFEAIVVIADADAMAHRFVAVGDRQRILATVGEIDDGRAEDRPVAGEADPAAESNLLAVAQILDRRIDIAVEAQIADRRIG